MTETLLWTGWALVVLGWAAFVVTAHALWRCVEEVEQELERERFRLLRSEPCGL